MVDTNTVRVQLSENQGSKIKGVGGNMVDYVLINGKNIAHDVSVKQYHAIVQHEEQDNER